MRGEERSRQQLIDELKQLRGRVAELAVEAHVDQTQVPGKGKILVMDDEEQIRMLFGRLLTRAGYQVEFATDGAEAVDLYRNAMEAQEPFDALVPDLTIPGGMGGKEALAVLAKVDPKVKAVVTSGYSNDPIMADFTRYGFSAALGKPFKVAELSQILHDILRS